MSSIEREIPELWKRMMNDGWVNVTGLTVMTGPMSGLAFVRVLPNLAGLAGWGQNNGKSSAHLPDGTVWLTHGYRTPPSFPGDDGSADFVPSSNGGIIHSDQLLARFRNPFWNGGCHRKVSRLGEEFQRGAEYYVGYPATFEELQEHPDYIAALNLFKATQPL